MRIHITEEQDGILLRAFLTAHLHLSSKMIKYLKYRPDGICVNGQQVTVRHILRKGDCLELAAEDSAHSEKVDPVELPIEILFENDDLVVPSKPGNMPTHPSRDHYRDTVANALAFRYREAGIPFVFRPVNRLDRNTSGLLLVARNKRASGELNRALQKGQIGKSYLAIVTGCLKDDEGEISLPLHRSRESIIIRQVCSPDAPDASPALTRYRVRAKNEHYTLVEASPITGRTHQLRVHFAALGHPMLGDDLYGTPSPIIPRQALHAYRLTFPMPFTGEALTLTAPLPEDMEAALRHCFPHYPIP